MPNQVEHGSVDNAQQDLRIDSQNKHEGNGHCHQYSFLKGQVRPGGPLFVERSVKHTLENRQDKDGGDKKAEDSQGSRPRGQRKGPFKNQEFTDESVQAWKT